MTTGVPHPVLASRSVRQGKDRSVLGPLVDLHEIRIGPSRSWNDENLRLRGRRGTLAMDPTYRLGSVTVVAALDGRNVLWKQSLFVGHDLKFF